MPRYKVPYGEGILCFKKECQKFLVSPRRRDGNTGLAIRKLPVPNFVFSIFRRQSKKDPYVFVATA
jgi:hypothetical protein